LAVGGGVFFHQVEVQVAQEVAQEVEYHHREQELNLHNRSHLTARITETGVVQEADQGQQILFNGEEVVEALVQLEA
jgi:hypothetical protein